MQRLRIIVTGLIGTIPLAGLAVHYLQYVLGLKQLGHEVLYLEDAGSWYYDPRTDAMVDDVQVPLTQLHAVLDAHGLLHSWRFVDHQGTAFGCTEVEFSEFLESADLLINVTGAGMIREEYLGIPRRVYVDTDPGYIQFRVAQGSQRDREHLLRHTDHFTFGCNIGKENCHVPSGGFHWRPTVQPIVLSLWPSTPPSPEARPFTTVMKWKTYAPESHDGTTLGMKDLEFERYLDLPAVTGQPLELAMAGPAPLDQLVRRGWRIESGPRISASIGQYRSYLQQSRGEWSVAKNGYVVTRSGWFSERSACYLASGRPVVVQQTGFSDWLPAVGGVVPFDTPEEAASAIRAVNQQYRDHCRIAREIAEQYFDSAQVLTRLVDDAMRSGNREGRDHSA